MRTLPDTSTLTVVLVLVAAMVHAGWNALLFAGNDQLAKTQLLVAMYVIVGIVLMFFFAKSTMSEVVSQTWPWLLASAVGYIFYFLGLSQSYRTREFSAVYGVMRGTGPILIAIGALLLHGQRPSPLAFLAIIVVSGGVFLLKWSGSPTAMKRAVPWAVLNALGVALTFLADGSGVQQAGDPLGFFGCALLFGGIGALIVLAFVPMRVGRLPKVEFAKGVVAGLMSVLTYSIGIWAVTVHPFGKVAALRETSVLFGLLYGWLLLGEAQNSYRIWGCVAVVSGAGALAWFDR
jgi:drug/metabolite transporter (DMT)-like permease